MVNPITDKPNVKKVVSLLKRHCNKPIQIKNIEEFAQKPGTSYIANYLGTVKEYSERIEVHLNYSVAENVREAILVHELLHILMRHRGFPGIATRAEESSRILQLLAPQLEKLRYFFSSTVDHLYIYKIMQTDFNLDLAPYYEAHIKAKTTRFSRFSFKDSPKNAEYYFQVQQDILEGLEYYEYPNPYRQNILQLFKETDPDGFASCSALYSKLRKMGFSTPENMYRCANLIKIQIIKYGEKKSVGEFNLLWNAINVVRDAQEIPLEN
ncbi:hypothetical protein ACFLU9_01900 [Chloroflexota bacterium]